MCRTVTARIGVAPGIQYGELSEASDTGVVTVPDTDEIGVRLSSDHRERGVVMTMPVDECQPNAVMFDDGLVPEPLADGSRVVVASDGSELAAGGLYEPLELREHRLGHEITAVTDEISLTESCRGPSVEARLVGSVGVGEYEYHTPGLTADDKDFFL